MTPRSARLRRVLRLRETEEKAQCRRMGEAQRRLDDAAARLEELREWRRRYAEGRDLPRQVPSSHLQDYQRFLERLDEAIRAQARLVEDGRRQRDSQRQRWLATRRRSESLERVVAGYADAESRERERAAQQAADDRPPAPPPFAEPSSG
ncbi:MAG TPA: flagellar export protein FliJ [Woeseiaceae bacterium]|nr:flagellar export protein FliJ [Woeseiaceae bacterium]